MPDIHFADISEWQANIDADAYIGGGHRVIICRTHNGNRPDRMIPARRDYLRSKPFVALGWYQYLVRNRDAAQQAREFMATVGEIGLNEFPVLDLEEGTGDQVGRANAWFAVVDRWAGFQSTLYAGASMLKGQIGGSARWGRRPLWIASYPATYTANPRFEPPGNTFWQYSDRKTFPGLAGGNDGNIYHGTAEQFLARVRGGRTAPVAPPPELDVAVARNGDLLEEFAERPDGEIWHRWQRGEGTPWSDWYSMGKPG